MSALEAAADTIRVVSPATGELVGEVPDEAESGVARAVEAARAAAPGWKALGHRGRAEALRRWRDAVLDDTEVVPTLVAESGKPRQEAEGLEIFYLCELIRFAIGAAPRALREESRLPHLFLTKKTLVVRNPLGVVGVIGPWNFPILNNAADCVAPLLAGNAAVLKPSEVTPLSSVRLAELWRAAGNPPDVFRVVTGRGAAGAALVDRVDGVMFTGSVATGRKVAARAAERLIPCVTELGGKSPFVVLKSADLPRAAEAAAWSSFMNSGQVCIRTERIYVEEAVADRFEELLTDRVKALRQRPADPHADGGLDVSSVTFPRQIEVVERHLADALAKGARIAAGGRRPPGLSGNFFEPTLLLGATQEMDVMREETFGPLVAVMRVRDAGEALRLANDSHLGLNAMVFGASHEAEAFARRLESGQVITNDVTLNYIVVEAPLGGWKASGLGVRHGVEGIRQWTRTQAIILRRPLLAPLERLVARLLAFPYDPRVLALLRRAMRLLYRSGLGERLRRPPEPPRP